jgi:hypothetical protein
MARSHTSPPAPDGVRRTPTDEPVGDAGADGPRDERSVSAWVRRSLAAFRAPRSPAVLGEGHPLGRTIALRRTILRQATATSTMVGLGVVAVLEGYHWGARLLGAASLVELTLLGIFALVRQVQREHVLRLIAAGRGAPCLPEVSCETSRLASPQHMEELASRLERTLDDARRWHELAVASRPPPGLRLLCEFGAEVDTIVGQLRAGDASLPGLALLELMLSGGYESTLYAGDRNALREQLWRIRLLLSRSDPRQVEHAGG